MVVTPSGFAIYELLAVSSAPPVPATAAHQAHSKAPPAPRAAHGKGANKPKPGAKTHPLVTGAAPTEPPPPPDVGRGGSASYEGGSSEPVDPKKERARLLELVRLC